MVCELCEVVKTKMRLVLTTQTQR